MARLSTAITIGICSPGLLAGHAVYSLADRGVGQVAKRVKKISRDLSFIGTS